MNNPLYSIKGIFSKDLFKRNFWPVFLLIALFIFLIIYQFRFPLALNMDGGYNAANVKALMHFKSMPFTGSPILPFALSALFGWVFGGAIAGIKIVTALALVGVGLIIFLFVRKVTKDELASIGSLLAWCVSLAILTYPMGYLKQTVALPFVVFGLVALYFWINEKKTNWGVVFCLSLVIVYFSHQPSFMALCVTSFFVTACLLPGSEVKQGKTISISMWGLALFGLISSPWTVPFLSRYIIQLDANGYRDILIYLKGLFSYRFQMRVDFNGFDWLFAAIPVFGLGWTIKVWRRLGLWILGFGLGIFILSCFVTKYEWQGRNIMMLYVPLSMLIGFGFYHLSGFLAERDKARTALAITLALVAFLLAGYQHTVKQYAKTARPIISTNQLGILTSLLENSPSEVRDNLYSRHGLRFWATYTDDKFTGVYFYDWERKTLSVRKTRGGGDDLTSGRDPKPGDYLLISKQPMFGSEYQKIASSVYTITAPKKCEEIIGIDIESMTSIVDPYDSILVLSSLTTGEIYKIPSKPMFPYHGLDFKDQNKINEKLRFILGNTPKGLYRAEICPSAKSSAPYKGMMGFDIEVTENLLQYSKQSFEVVEEFDEYLVITPKN